MSKYGPVIPQSVIAVCLLTVPLCCALESPGECSDEPKYVVLDYDDLSAYSFAHGTCKDGATCKCLPGDIHSITKAYIYDRNGMEYDLFVSDDQHHFEVVLPKLNQPLPGMHTYSFGYEYECLYYTSLSSTCHKGSSKEMDLTIKIVDYKLRVDGSSSVVANTSGEENSITLREKFGSNVTLLCSSSLMGVNDSALDIPVEFVFNSSGTNKSGGCMNSKNITTEDNWIIHRQIFPPYECTLTIVDFSSKDTGEYQCAGLLPREDDSQFKKDWSKVTVTLLSNDLPPTKPPKTGLKYLALISIGAVLLLIPGFLFIVYKKYRKRSQRGRRPNLVHASSTTSLVSHRSLHQNYGTAISSLGTESTSSRETVGNEGEIESNLSQRTVQVFVEEPSTGGRSGRTLSQSIHESQEGTHTSTISAGTEGRQYYKQYTNILHPDGRQTPEKSEAPLNENYKCRHCGTIYHDDQRLYYARHVKEGQKRCPNYNGETGMNTTNKNTLDTNGARLPDNLTIGPYEGAPRSRGSTMSEIREGKGYYNDYIEVEVPESGPTPEETEVPLDNHYRCPFCGKTYHKNQRLYFKRHIDELWIRCPKYESLMAAKDRPPSSKSSYDLD